MSRQEPSVSCRQFGAVDRVWRAGAYGVALGGAAGALTAGAVGSGLMALGAVDVAGTVLFGSAVGALAAVIARALARRVRRPCCRALLGAAVGTPALWVSCDLLYSALVRRSYARWEAATARGPDGVRRGCEALTVGRGEAAILLIHGLADSPAVYRRMAHALAANGFTCEAMRLPHSGTPAPSATPFPCAL
jgi:hypothetical protein